MRFRVGDFVRWIPPLEPDYSYGYIKAIKGKYVNVEETGYYKGKLTEVHIRNLRLVQKGGRSGGNKDKKYS